MIFRMQYSERIPYGPTSLRFMISVVVMSVSVVSVGGQVENVADLKNKFLARTLTKKVAWCKIQKSLMPRDEYH